MSKTNNTWLLIANLAFTYLLFFSTPVSAAYCDDTKYDLDGYTYEFLGIEYPVFDNKAQHVKRQDLGVLPDACISTNWDYPTAPYSGSSGTTAVLDANI